jgi:hypothetical protein
MRQSLMQRDFSSLSIQSSTPSLDDSSACTSSTPSGSMCNNTPPIIFRQQEAGVGGGGTTSSWHLEIPKLSSSSPSSTPGGTTEKKGDQLFRDSSASTTVAGVAFGVSNNAPCSPKNRRCIEVMPGTYMPLIGTDETKVAMKEGRMVHTCCFICNLQVVCTDEADCVLCPSCRGVSPITSSSSSSKARNNNETTVGLGLTEANYIQFQREQEHQPLTRATF